MYIGKREDEALHEFSKPETIDRRKLVLYESIIYPAFKKLVDNLLYKYNQKAEDINNDLRSDCISHLVSKIEKYDFNRGNSFSFFNVIAKHFILQNIGRKKKLSPLVTVFRKDVNDMTNGTDENNLLKDALIADQFIDTTYLTAGEGVEDTFMHFLQLEVTKLMAKAKTTQESDFYGAIITIIEQHEKINISNKKLLYSMIREITNMKSRDITKHINVLKGEYGSFLKKYYD